jgi:hypothetical protein
MKTYKNLYPRIWIYDNLYVAWRAAARRKRKSPGVAGFEYALTDNLLQLEEELRTQSYRPGPYRHFLHHLPQAPAHQCRTVPGPGGTPCLGAADRAHFCSPLQLG